VEFCQAKKRERKQGGLLSVGWGVETEHATVYR
jgi:hypothetical protein